MERCDNCEFMNPKILTDGSGKAWRECHANPPAVIEGRGEAQDVRPHVLPQDIACRFHRAKLDTTLEAPKMEVGA